MVESQAGRLDAHPRPAGPLIASALLLVVALGPAVAVLEIPLPIVMGVTGGLALVVFALRPDFTTPVVIALLYSNAAVVAVHFHGVPFIVAAAVPLLLAVPLGYHVLLRRQPLAIPPAVLWMGGYLLVMMLSTMMSANSSAAAESVGIFVTEGLILFLLIVNSVRTERMVVVVVWTLLGVGLVLGLLSIHQELTQSFGDDYFGFAQVGGTPDLLAGDDPASRTAGPFGRANRYAQIMVVLIPLAIAMIWARTSRLAVFAAVATGAVAAIATALTLSRGAAVSLAVLVVVMLLLRYIKVRHLAIVAVAVVALFLVVPAYGARLETLDRVPGIADEGVRADGSVRSRITEMIAAALVFVDHPIIGVGPGQFPSYYIEYAEKFGLRVRAEDREAHSLYVGLAAELGVSGTIFFLGAIGVTLRDLIRTRARLMVSHPRVAHLAAGVFLALVTYLSTAIFLHLAFERYLWLLLALGAAVVVVGRRLVPDGQTIPTVSGGPSTA